jgi:hypothetical protein
VSFQLSRKSQLFEGSFIPILHCSLTVLQAYLLPFKYQSWTQCLLFENHGLTSFTILFQINLQLTN